MSDTIVRDVLVIVAVTSVGYGLWIIHPSAALIGVGLITLIGLANGSKNK